MRAFDLIIGKVVLFSSIVVVPMATLLSMNGSKTGAIWDAIGWVFIFWIILTMYFVVKLLVNTELRYVALTGLLKIKERDEREGQIAGEAAKFSMLSTMALVLLFIFLSSFTVTLAKNKDIEAEPGKKGYLSIGLKFNVEKNAHKLETRENYYDVVNYSGLPFSEQIALIIVMVWLVLNYHFYSQKLLKDMQI